MADFKLGCSPLTSRIFAGKVLKDGTWGVGKKDVTDTAPAAVAQYLLQTEQRLEFTYSDGRKYCLKVERIA